MKQNLNKSHFQTTNGSLAIHNIDINDYCNLFNSLRKKYQWTEKQWTPISKSMERIKRRANDERLFLGVIGEFSSGKSTFINALLREEILKTDILPATTCAVTVLGYGNKVDAEINFHDGTVARYTQNGLSWWNKLSQKLFRPTTEKQFESAKSFIHRYTAEETQAKTVVQVNVTHPNDKLKSGLMIVDTPGLNAENYRHTQVTKTAIHQLCDAFVLLVPATAACSSNLIDFVKENIAETTHRCIVLVSKIDLIAPRERTRLMKYVTSRLENELGKRFAIVVAAAPCHVFPNEPLLSQINGEKLTTYYAEFEETEKTILRILNNSRASIIAEQLVAILVDTLVDLNKAVEARHEEYRLRHEALEKNRLPDFQKFIETHKSNYGKKIRKTSEYVINSLLEDVAKLREQLNQTIEADINSARGKGDLKKIVETTTSGRFKAMGLTLEVISKEAVTQISQQCQVHLNEFQREFQKSYRNLSTLGGIIKESESITTALSQVQTITTTQTANSSIQTVNAVNTSTAFKAAGASTGAVVGSFICPGIGTVIGAGVGFILGSLFGPSLDELKKTAITDSNKAISRWMSECGDQMRMLIGNHINTDLQNLFLVIDKYADIYALKVQEMINQDEIAKQQLTDYIKIAKDDLAELHKREERCRSTINALKTSIPKHQEEVA